MYAYTIYNNFPCITIIIKISFDFPCKEFNLRNLSINIRGGKLFQQSIYLSIKYSIKRIHHIMEI